MSNPARQLNGGGRRSPRMLQAHGVGHTMFGMGAIQLLPFSRRSAGRSG
ncbi:MAG: hypothetical protein M5U07_23815 [Xanthobacteraceae bacterium]|nr:hypothetical protein [Xanthobacteraceae bacterium]